MIENPYNHPTATKDPPPDIDPVAVTFDLVPPPPPLQLPPELPPELPPDLPLEEEEEEAFFFFLGSSCIILAWLP